MSRFSFSSESLPELIDTISVLAEGHWVGKGMIWLNSEWRDGEASVSDYAHTPFFSLAFNEATYADEGVIDHVVQNSIIVIALSYLTLRDGPKDTRALKQCYFEKLTCGRLLRDFPITCSLRQREKRLTPVIIVLSRSFFSTPTPDKRKLRLRAPAFFAAGGKLRALQSTYILSVPSFLLFPFFEFLLYGWSLVLASVATLKGRCPGTARSSPPVGTNALSSGVSSPHELFDWYEKENPIRCDEEEVEDDGSEIQPTSLSLWGETPRPLRESPSANYAFCDRRRESEKMKFQLLSSTRVSFVRKTGQALPSSFQIDGSHLPPLFTVLIPFHPRALTRPRSYRGSPYQEKVSEEALEAGLNPPPSSLPHHVPNRRRQCIAAIVTEISSSTFSLAFNRLLLRHFLHTEGGIGRSKCASQYQNVAWGRRCPWSIRRLSGVIDPAEIPSSPFTLRGSLDLALQKRIYPPVYCRIAAFSPRGNDAIKGMASDEDIGGGINLLTAVSSIR
ncbi:unnamed protein product [Cyprideis torosa]|uniref:Uncharacterized protein n=1 Tax=Cyprideis torosa TaxID=163714 RepID=A0A7R8W7M1_9CRUS|nr:unnamed protein product [Cyprideis torosa]CAG0882599.1 unnamed protein product [Cyprideis torosa]